MKKIVAITVLISLLLQFPAFGDNDLEVSGIYYLGKPKAIVDGKTLTEGEMIGNAKVVKIGEEYVQFDVNGKIITRRVGEKSQKTIAKEKYAESVHWIVELFMKLRAKFTPKKETKPSAPKAKLNELVEAKERARAELEKVKQRNKDAREAIRQKIEAVKGTGLENYFDPRGANYEEPFGDEWEK